MKVYRVHFYDSVSSSHGFEFFSSKEAANACSRAWNREDQEDTGRAAEVDCFDFDCTKRGVLALLKRVATHPDNG